MWLENNVANAGVRCLCQLKFCRKDVKQLTRFQRQARSCSPSEVQLCFSAVLYYTTKEQTFHRMQVRMQVRQQYAGRRSAISALLDSGYSKDTRLLWRSAKQSLNCEEVDERKEAIMLLYHTSVS